MEPIAIFTAEQVASNVIAEAIDEVTGETNRRWALRFIVIAAVAGVVWYVVKRRRDAGPPADDAATAG